MKVFPAILFMIFFFLPAPGVRAASLDDVIFLRKIETYEAAKETTLVTQEGKKTPIKKGTILNVAGFTQNDALVVSRKDKPNGFIKRTDIAPVQVKKK